MDKLFGNSASAQDSGVDLASGEPVVRRTKRRRLVG
jgi:hypothetical protein